MPTLIGLFVVVSILLLLITYFYSKSLCFALILPLRACANQMVESKLLNVSGVELDPGDVLGLVTIFLCVLFIVTYYQSIFSTATARRFSIAIFFLLAWYLLTAGLSHATFFNLTKWTKMASWLLLVPVAMVVFDSLEEISALRRWAIISLVITLSSVLIANIFGIGPVAYADKGGLEQGFHLGYYASESALSLALAMAIPLLFLPYLKDHKIKAKLSKLAFLLLLINFVCILSIFVRASILAVLLGVISYIFLSRKNKLTGLSYLTATGIVVIIIAVIAVFSLTHQAQIQSRFSDVISSHQTREQRIESLGSGRVWLLKTYFEQWRSRGIAYRILGVDTGTGGGQKIDYRLSSGTHNDIMTMLYKGGIVGLILYVWLIWQVFLALFARLRGNPDDVSHHLAVVGFSALTVYSIFVIHGGTYQILPMSYFAMLIGAVAAYRPQKAQISVPDESV
jgi:O-antigen ligase